MSPAQPAAPPPQPNPTPQPSPAPPAQQADALPGTPPKSDPTTQPKSPPTKDNIKDKKLITEFNMKNNMRKSLIGTYIPPGLIVVDYSNLGNSTTSVFLSSILPNDVVAIPDKNNNFKKTYIPNKTSIVVALKDPISQNLARSIDSASTRAPASEPATAPETEPASTSSASTSTTKPATPPGPATAIPPAPQGSANVKAKPREPANVKASEPAKESDPAKINPEQINDIQKQKAFTVAQSIVDLMNKR